MSELKIGLWKDTTNLAYLQFNSRDDRQFAQVEWHVVKSGLVVVVIVVEPLFAVLKTSSHKIVMDMVHKLSPT